MSSVFELISNWITVNYGIESLIETLRVIQQQGAIAGKLQPTKHPNVFLQEVPTTVNPRSKIEIGQIKWIHGVLEDAWGKTRCSAVLQYALPLAKDGNYPLILMGIQLDADIKLKPKKEFKDIKEFAPLYQMLREDERFRGNKAAFCAAMATRTFSEYTLN